MKAESDASRSSVALLALGLIGLLAVALYERWPALDPYSLWLDDQWVTVLARYASLRELFELGAPVPLGFVVMLKMVMTVFGDHAWTMQIAPLVFGLVQIPLIGWLAFRITGRVSLGLFAAALLTGSRTFAIYNIRVKQFSFESLVTLVLLALAVLWLQRRGRGTWLALITVAALSMLASFTAAIVGLLVVNGLLLHRVLGADDELPTVTRATIVGCLLYDAFAVAFTALVHASQSNSDIVSFWNVYYMPLNDWSAAWAYLSSDGVRFLVGAVPGNLSWLAVGAAIAPALLLIRRGWRLAGVGLIVFYVGLLAASAMHLYPLGGRRTDIFSYPVTILAITVAIWLARRRSRVLPAVALGVVLLEIVLFFPRMRIRYADAGGRAVIELVSEHASNSDDGLIVAPQTNWAMGCYGRWPVRLVRVDDSTNGFFVEIERAHSLVLRESAIDAQLDRFCLTAPDRIYFVSIRRSPARDQRIVEVIETHGYAAVSIESPDELTLVRFDRVDAPLPRSR